MVKNITLASLFALLGVWSPLAAQSADSSLMVTNGDFGDLTDLAPMPNGWYAGVPTGWTGMNSSEGSTNYAVWRDAAGNFVANVSALSQPGPTFIAFEQEVGQLGEPADVTLSFEVLEPWHDPSFLLGAAIYDSLTQVPLAFGDFTNCGTQTLVATNVTAGTRIKVGFWSARSFPKLDNVAIKAEAVK